MQQKEMTNWIEYIADHVYQYYRGRKVVLWGKYNVAENINNKLKEKYDIDAVFYVDGNSQKIDNREVFSPDVLSGKPTEYYVVIPLAVYQSIKDILFKGGYKQDIDYFYFCDCALREETNYYEDAHGNKLIGNRQGINFAFSGFNSVVEIGDNVRFRKSSFYVHNNSQIIIGDNAVMEDTVIQTDDDSKVTIGNNARILNVNLSIEKCAAMVLGDSVYMTDSGIHIWEHADYEIGPKCGFKYFFMEMRDYTNISIGEEVEFRGSSEHRAQWSMLHKARMKIEDRGLFKYGNLHLNKNSFLKIGKNFSIETNYSICADKDTSILIGEDCMFSSDAFLRTNDGHSIFDVETGENINSSYAIRKAKNIMIGSHVWVGVKSVILYNAIINDGCIIGAMSMVKCEVPNNCMAAGIPAKIVRTNVAWSRKDDSENILDCGQDYIHMTGEKRD